MSCFDESTVSIQGNVKINERATAGFEPATHSLGNCRSILLSYGRMGKFDI